MSNTTISPNMLLPVPIPSVDPGPDWANNIVADMYAIDSHDHTSGKGVPITPDGLNISADLPMNEHNLTEVRSVNFEAQAAPLALAGDLGCIYVSGADLYYNDEAGNQVRITQGGSVTGSSGTITGLPSGTASASYSAGTFTFQSATSTPATMAVGPLVIGRVAASSKTVTLAPNAAQAANFNVTFPPALPAAANYTTLDASGNISFNSSGTTGTGAVVLAAAPTLTGVVTSSGTVEEAVGSAAAPSYSFTGDNDTGMYRVSANTLGLSAGGTNRLSLTADGATVSGRVQTSDGDVSNPAYYFTSDTNTGMYADGADAIGFTTGGTRGLSVTATAVAIPGSFEMGGNGAFKTKIFTGSLAASAPTTLTNPGTVLLGAFGASTVDGGTDYAPMDYDKTGGTTTDSIRFQSQVPVGSAGVRIANYDTNSTNSYRVIMFYQ